ncbi:hypothetical protein [Streptomyces sp. NPDC050548]|uniref:hypothetical protein n=1 Tax=Streptomyces sp. NPDC050548 TaxID=3365629 RepID=UPI00378F527D
MAAATTDVIRFGPHRTRQKIRQEFGRAAPGSVDALAAGNMRLTVHRITGSSPLCGLLTDVVNRNS